MFVINWIESVRVLEVFLGGTGERWPCYSAEQDLGKVPVRYSG